MFARPKNVCIGYNLCHYGFPSVQIKGNRMEFFKTIPYVMNGGILRYVKVLERHFSEILSVRYQSEFVKQLINQPNFRALTLVPFALAHSGVLELHILFQFSLLTDMTNRVPQKLTNQQYTNADTGFVPKIIKRGMDYINFVIVPTPRCRFVYASSRTLVIRLTSGHLFAKLRKEQITRRYDK